MIIVKHVKMLVPSELLYAFDPTSEDLFIIARERGRLTARPVSECGFLPECGLRNDCCTSTHKFNMTSNRNYDRRCMLYELDDALNNLIFRWNICLAANAEYVADKECHAQIQKRVQTGLDYLNQIKNGDIPQ